MIVESEDGTILKVADDAIRGKSKNADGSWDFGLVGGPYNGHTIRIYKLGEPVVWNLKDGTTMTYEMHPPAKRGNPWVYIHKRKES